MFAENRPYRIEFQLPEAQRGKTTHIRNLEFDERGIHTFEGLLPDYETTRRYLAAFGVVPLQTPDVAQKVERPVPRGIGKAKVAIVEGVRDDLDDLSEFKAKPDGAPLSPAPQGNGQPPAPQVARPEAPAGVQHGSGTGAASPPASGPVPTGADGVGTEAEVSDADFDFS